LKNLRKSNANITKFFLFCDFVPSFIEKKVKKISTEMKSLTAHKEIRQQWSNMKNNGKRLARAKKPTDE